MAESHRNFRRQRIAIACEMRRKAQPDVARGARDAQLFLEVSSPPPSPQPSPIHPGWETERLDRRLRPQENVRARKMARSVMFGCYSSTTIAADVLVSCEQSILVLGEIAMFAACKVGDARKIRPLCYPSDEDSTSAGDPRAEGPPPVVTYVSAPPAPAAPAAAAAAPVAAPAVNPSVASSGGATIFLEDSTSDDSDEQD